MSYTRGDEDRSRRDGRSRHGPGGVGRLGAPRYTRRSVKSTVETLENNKVKVVVEVDEAEFEKEVDAAFRRIAKEVRLPGFRPGKAPRKLLEARLGAGVGREEALRESLPSFYTKAVIEHEVDVIAPPEIDITAGRDAGPVVFDAVVEVRPSITVAGYQGLRVELPNPVPSDEEIGEHIDRMRQQFAELQVAERPAADGDHVTIDIAGSYDDEPLPGLTAEDYLYEVGRGLVVAEIDEHLRGASAGDELTFSAAHPDPDEEGELSFTVVVKEVKEKVLPEVDDEFATMASEFETAAELRADVERRLGAVKRSQARFALRAKTQEALAALVDEDVPDAMIGNEMNSQLQDLANRLQQQGMNLDQYFGMMGRSPEEVSAELRESATEAVKIDLALRAVVESEGLGISDEELDAEIAEFAEQVKQDLDDVKARFAAAGQLGEIRVGLAKGKALDWLLERVEVVDESGAPIDRALLEADEDDTDEDDDEFVDLDDSDDDTDDETEEDSE